MLESIHGTRPVVAVALLGLGLLASAPARAAAGTLSPQERSIARAVDAGVPRSLALLERLVDTNSGTLHRDGVREVGAMLAPEFESLGFRTRWIDGSAWQRAGHLVAERPGRGARLRALLIGHLDTVFEQDSPFQRFERLDDSTARGPGVCDMKGGDVVMLLALRALLEAHALDALDVTCVLTGDEERNGEPLALARADLLAAARGRDVAIGFEDGAGDPRTPVIARRSASGWSLHVSGTAAHSSQIFKPDVGAGAVFEAARILEQWRDSLADEPSLSFNPGLIAGGSAVEQDRDGTRAIASGKSNVVADSAIVSGDLRALAPEQRARVEATMRRIVERALPHTSARLEFEEGYPPLPPTDGNRDLLAEYDRASRDLGDGPVEAVAPDRAGAADLSFTAGIVPMAIDGVGLMGTGGHTVRETADLRTLPENAKRIALVLHRMALERSGRAASGPAGHRPRRSR